MRNAHRILVRRIYMYETTQDTNRRIILEWILKEYDWNLWIELT
jgi:hypothetical protein